MNSFLNEAFELLDQNKFLDTDEELRVFTISDVLKVGPNKIFVGYEDGNTEVYIQICDPEDKFYIPKFSELCLSEVSTLTDENEYTWHRINDPIK